MVILLNFVDQAFLSFQSWINCGHTVYLDISKCTVVQTMTPTEGIDYMFFSFVHILEDGIHYPNWLQNYKYKVIILVHNV